MTRSTTCNRKLCNYKITRKNFNWSFRILINFNTKIKKLSFGKVAEEHINETWGELKQKPKEISSNREGLCLTDNKPEKMVSYPVEKA